MDEPGIGLTPEEKEKLHIARERTKEIDIDFLVKSFCSMMIKEKPDFIVQRVITFFAMAEEICLNAASQAGADTVERGITIDRAVDGMRVFLELSETLHMMAGLFQHALDATEEHGEYGLFTHEQDHLNRKLEEMRRMLIDMKNRHDLGLMRRTKHR